jgi:hypothetical protein
MRPCNTTPNHDRARTVAPWRIAMLLVLGVLAVPAIAEVNPAGATLQGAKALQNIPLASYPEGEAMMRQAISQLKLDLKFSFLNKDYEDDKYVRDPVTGNKVRVSCVRFKADSGFQFKIDPPQYALTPQGLTVTQNIAKIRADGLTSRFQLGPCAWVGAGLGLQLTDVKYVYKARPMLNFGSEACKLVWNNDPNSLQISIGDLNIIGVQNDIDKLAKTAVREGVNYTLDAMLGSALRGELQKVVISACGSGSGLKVR